MACCKHSKLFGHLCGIALTLFLVQTIHCESLSGQTVITVYQSSTIREVKAYLQKSTQDIQNLNQSRQQLSALYDSMVIQISVLKEKEDPPFWERWKLKGLLQETEDVSQQIVRNDKLANAYRENNHQKAQLLISLMEDEIRDLLQQLKPLKKIDETKVDLLKAMWSERIQAQLYLIHDPLLSSIQNIFWRKSDEGNVLQAKGDFLMDQHDKLIRYADEIDKKINAIRLEMALIRECSKVLQSYADAQSLIEDEPDEAFYLFLSKTKVNSADSFAGRIYKLQNEKDFALFNSERFRSSADDAYFWAEQKSGK